MSDKFSFEKVTQHLQNVGFVYQGSSIYGGLSNTWDYGPLGAEMKRNIRSMWWKKFVQESPTNVGLDAAILMNPKVWEATGHVTTFNDPLIDCKSCKSRFRADNLIEEQFKDVNVNGMSQKEMNDFIKEHNVICPVCGKSNFTDIRQFNMMFKTHIGVTDDSKSEVYLRPETAQGVFVNFKNVQRSTRKKIPFGICNTGKVFRNEMTPGNFTFRTREFEQMELEFFCKPGEDLDWFKYWKDFCRNWLLSLGIKEENLRYRDHEKEELSFYSKATTDIEYLYPMGFGELWGIADRTDYDLNVHMEHSKTDMRYMDPETNEKYLPYVIEPSVGLDRLVLALLNEGYNEETLEGGDTRVVLKLKPFLAPCKVAILPLIKKKHADKAMEVYKLLSSSFMVTYDESGNIGKRYRRADAVGTPYCISIDDETMEHGTVTIRERDTMEQITLNIEDVKKYIEDKISF